MKLAGMGSSGGASKGALASALDFADSDLQEKRNGERANGEDRTMAAAPQRAADALQIRTLFSLPRSATPCLTRSADAAAGGAGGMGEMQDENGSIRSTLPAERPAADRPGGYPHRP